MEFNLISIGIIILNLISIIYIFFYVTTYYTPITLRIVDTNGKLLTVTKFKRNEFTFDALVNRLKYINVFYFTDYNSVYELYNFYVERESLFNPIIKLELVNIKEF